MKLPERYPMTVAYMTRFRSKKQDGEPVNFVFSNCEEDNPVGRLSAADVFEILKPELRLEGGAIIKIGQQSYRGVTLRQPEAEAKGGELPIRLDSMLLRQVTGQAVTHRKVGGKLFRQLLEDLDVVVRFSGPKFVRALLEMARLYLAQDVDAGGPELNQVGSAQIEELLDDPLIADAVLRILQAPAADVPRARKALEVVLGEATIGAISKTDRTAMRERFVESLVRLRDEVLIGGNTVDKSMVKILGRSQPGEKPKDERAAAVTEWFWDFSKHKEAFELGEMRTSPGDSFPDYYQHYMHHAENVHRFVRSPVLHSFVFMWLMSKYKIYSSAGTFRKTAQEAFRRGVQGAADRKLGESDSDRALRKNSAAASGEKRVEGFESGELPDGTTLTEEDVERKKRMARQMVEAATNVFNAETTFYRRQLQELLETYFLDAAAATSGALKQVLDDSREFVSKYRNTYTRLLGILNHPANFRKPKKIESEIAKLGTGAYKDALQAVADRAREVLAQNEESKPEDVTAQDEVAATYRRHVSNQVLDQFASEVGATSIQYFSDRFDEKAGAIQGQIAELKQIYRADRKINDASQKVKSAAAGAGMPSAVASDRVFKAGPTEAIVKKISGGNPATEYVFPSPDQVRSEFDNGDTPGMVSGKLDTRGKTIGTVEMTRDATKVMIDAPEFDKIEPGQDVTLTTEGFENVTIDTLDPDGNIRSFVADIAHDRPLSDEEIKNQVEKLSNYGEQRESMRALYCGKGAEDLDQDALEDFERAMRALHLGEFLQAAPDAESRLAVADVSQTVRLMLDLVRNVGDLQNDEQANDAPDRKTLDALGPEKPDGGPKARLDLSTYFQVPDKDGGRSIQNAMTYHDTLCESVMRVGEHLADINDLKAIAEALPADAKLVVVNSTVAEHMQDLLEGADEHFLLEHQHPSVILLGRCAGPGSNWTSLRVRLEERFREMEEDVTLVCPMIVSHGEVDPSCPLPVAKLGDEFTKIAFAPMPPGEVPRMGEGEQPPADAKSAPGALLVQDARTLLSIPAAMALAPVLMDTTLGKFPDKKMSFNDRKAVKRAAGVSFQPGKEGELVVDFLRRCWREPRQNTALEAFVTARIATLALGHRLPAPSNYASFHNKFLAPAGVDGTSVDHGHPVLAGAGHLLGIGNPTLRFLIRGNHALDEDTHSARFFDGQQKIWLKIGSVKEASGGTDTKDSGGTHTKASGDKTDTLPEIPEQMRQALSFIGI